MHRSGDGNGVVVGEVRKTITVSLSRLMNSACAIQIRPRSDSPSLRNARTDGHTRKNKPLSSPIISVVITGPSLGSLVQ